MSLSRDSLADLNGDWLEKPQELLAARSITALGRASFDLQDFQVARDRLAHVGQRLVSGLALRPDAREIGHGDDDVALLRALRDDIELTRLMCHGA